MLDFSRYDRCVVIDFRKKICLKDSKSADAFLFPYLLKSKEMTVIGNFEELDNIDHIGFNFLYKLRWVVKITGGNLSLINVPTNLKKDISKLRIKINKDFDMKEKVI
ncbi:MAG: hypothetical protein R3Y13_04425 [bacterium]